METVTSSTFFKKILFWGSVSAIAFSLISCSPQVNYHGHVFTDSELEQVKPGMSQEQVKLALGTPDTTSALSGGAFFYISSRQEKTVAFMKPSETDRKVVAVYFNEKGEVTRIANYGLKDGQVFDFISKTTPSYKGSESFISKMFRGIGQRKMFDDGSATQ